MNDKSDQDQLKILLGVTGGVAAYKAPELVRRLKDHGAAVRVVMTAAGLRFVGPVTFQAVSGEPVRSDLWDPQAEAAMGHIELARWADLILVAPATANFMATLAAGLANDLLSTLCLASQAPLVIAPAMNQAMWSHPATQANRHVLEGRGVRFIGPADGEQACGDTGTGRMAEPRDIVEELLRSPPRILSQLLRNRTVMITAGPTREPIDPVRYITNRSSGKMGYALAAAAREAGARVILVSGPTSLPAPHGVRFVAVETAQEMFDAVHKRVAETDIFIGCAAVADYRPQAAAAEKIKRTEDTMSLSLVRSPDTLASVAALDNGPFTVGFAAETGNLERYARAKLEEKQLDMIAANQVGPGLAFDTDDNSLLVLWPGGQTELARAAKPLLARRLIDLIAQHHQAAGTQRHGERNLA
jgi:phosphopantothenoylcysteine decarboxylase/phosphopantothenate--cysteine ligase